MRWKNNKKEIYDKKKNNNRIYTLILRNVSLVSSSILFILFHAHETYSNDISCLIFESTMTPRICTSRLYMVHSYMIEFVVCDSVFCYYYYYFVAFNFNSFCICKCTDTHTHTTNPIHVHKTMLIWFYSFSLILSSGKEKLQRTSNKINMHRILYHGCVAYLYIAMLTLKVVSKFMY